eukprot:TRINITY_DN2560_c0_g1::TRINITY_DN2560_c0_g1_i1::g.19179::m.19179 TRINITY_DN2560_c0_g1::TRINITY_DN2560_c0_g1_i1::g.19179  ORF type:complete len:1829 (-),score=670.14,sp/Q84M24/AB1A_ARATH/37.15/0.0,ABC2_membrane_3/PF12698.2/1.1e-20,ABC2_membrane_3/PF12698.2/2.6e-40,ABC_tran/PF00005.22/8e-28,ABC_tran/PF00005.22/9.3e-22,AAA_21/PF13304.1/3.6,AAA_21/PF13304.1/0.00028,AAA_21/PF13304.1/1.1e+02,AAA_21/PF13304.1/0.00011,AAA_15/PF13175.1/1,AAA_15/PF13175.1/5.1e+02,AAA_15/PF13175.1/0.52,ABC2_membrane/PF01061
MKSFMSQLKVMLWKNYLLKKRHPVATFLEFFLPVAFIVLMAVLKLSLAPDEEDQENPTWAQPMDRFPYDYNWGTGLKVWDCEYPFGYTDFTQNSCAFALISEIPGDNTIRDQFQEFFLKVNTTYATETTPGQRAAEHGAFLTHNLLIFDNEDDLKDYIEDGDYDDLPPQLRISGAVVFKKGSPNWEYKVRVNHTSFEAYAPEWDYPQPWEKQTNPLEQRGNQAIDSAYGASGFTTLQFLTENFVLAIERGEDPLDLSFLTVKNSWFPIPKTTEDNFWTRSADFVAIIFVLFLLNSVSKLIRGIVIEKELRIKEGMMMMGLQGSVFYTAFFLTYLFIFTCIAALIAIFGKIMVLMEHSAMTVVFCIFFLFGLSVIGFCFLISVFFSRAKTAAFLGVLIFFAAFFFYFGVSDPEMSNSSKSLASLSPPVAFGLAMSTLATLEAGQTGAQWSNLYENFNNYSVGTGLSMMILDFFLYAFLGWYFDQVVPSEWGTKRPWYFLLTPSYWAEVFPCLNISSVSGRGSASEREVLLGGMEESEISQNEHVEGVPNELKLQESRGECVLIRGLKREFDTPRGIKVAVDNLNLTMYKGQITALLGHNGAGKTTTISMLVGLISPSSGTASVMGKSVLGDMAKIRSIMGVCPQHNILFDELSVREHLQLFASFKGVPPSQVDAEVDKIIQELGLTEKAFTQSMNLSGGQKRKLSVGIALIGGSKVVFLDEPTSGMDPYSRRFTWNVLQNNREGRVIVLTTHFMDEADLLGDRIAIMGEGQLKCCGSSLFLKNRYGVGYNMTCVKADEQTFRAETLTGRIRSFVPDATVLSNVGAEISFQLPLASSGKFEAMLISIEKDSQALGVRSYGLSVTTLEEVFLRVARGAEDPEERRRDRMSISQNVTLRASMSESTTKRPSNPRATSNQADAEVKDLVAEHLRNRKQDMQAGWQLYQRHIASIIWMRFRYAMRDRKFIAFTMIIPVITVALSLGLLRALLTNDEMESVHITTDDLNPNLDTTGRVPVYYPPGYATLNIPNQVIVMKDKLITDETQAVEMMSDYLIDTRECCEDSVYGALIVLPESTSESDLESGSESGSSTLVAPGYPNHYVYMYNMTGNHAPAIFMNLIHNGIAEKYSKDAGKPKVTMKLFNHPLPKTEQEGKIEQLIGTTNAIMLIVVAFGFIPTAFAVFVVRDREFKTKHQQLISGVDIFSYWIGLWLCDVFLYMVPCVLSVLIILAFDLEEFIEDGAYGSIWVVFLLYGPSCVSFTYLASNFFESHSTAQTILLLVNVFTGIILMFTAFILQLIAVLNDSISITLLKFLLHLFSFFPPFCLGNAMFNLAMREYDWFWWDVEGEDVKGPYDYDITGRADIFMAMLTVLYFGAVLVVEKMKAGHMFEKMNPDPHLDLEIEDEDEDVLAERKRVENQRDHGNDVVCLKKLRKVYHGRGNVPPKFAVKDLSFGIPAAECFGFLGINGAGKTTTLSMLACEIPPTSGTALIGGLDISKQVEEVRMLLGYCPQFDALYDLLSAREHLTLFANIKGVPKHRVEKVVNEKLEQLDLTEFADRLASTYSGGNKRKLQVAIALIGEPLIVFLDEPSTGMDPMARRFMWDVISKVSSSGHCSVILTTHAMEECEALCSRIGIMVGGRLRCLGPAQHLKNRFGQGFQVELKTRETRDQELKPLVEKLQTSGILLNGDVMKDDVASACRVLGNEARAMEVSPLGSGAALHQSLTKDGKIAVQSFVEWWVQEDFNRAAMRFMDSFEGTRLLEKHGAFMRFEVPSKAATLAALFGAIERSKESHFIQEYNLSQTSLEQIFNMFASQQEEETGAVGGMALNLPQ